ncbi:MAG TPA: hypothetical protein VI160_03595 [Gemmatimonadales bacterium]
MTRGWLFAGFWLGVAAPLAGQGTLADAAQRARQAWLAHDVQALVAQSTTVSVELPEASPSAPLTRAQAAEVLRRHLGSASERTLEVISLSEVEPGVRGFMELRRTYAVSGTAEPRRETLFFGFRRVGTEWVLTELRSAP